MLFSHKALGMELYQDGARMVLVSGKPAAPDLESFYDVSFPSDTLKISLREENVLNRTAFVAKIREAYLRLLAGTSRVAVSLPETAGRVILLDLETRFKTKDEGADIIRWKLKKNLPFEINEMQLDYQVAQERGTGEVSTLVTLISRQVVTQYEDLLLEAGLQPNRIDFTTFSIYRFFTSRLENIENATLIIWHAGILTVMLFQNGVLDFYRSKELSGDHGQTNRMYREISSSLQFYKDRQPGYSINEAFFVIQPHEADAMRAVIAEATGLEPVLLDAGRIIGQKAGTAPDAKTLHVLVAAMGAAVRNL